MSDSPQYPTPASLANQDWDDASDIEQKSGGTGLTTYILRRILQTIPVLVVVGILIFLMIRLIPGDPVTFLVPEDATQEQIDAVTAKLGLDQPIPVQFVLWARAALVGDFGESLHNRVPVRDLIAARLPASVELAVAAMVVTLAIGIPLGLASGLRPGSKLDVVASTFASVVLAVPLFWFAILLILYFAVYLGWVPPGARVGFDAGVATELRYLLLPAFSLGLAHAPFLSRFMRNGILEVSSEDYVRTAYAKGIPRSWVVRRHIIRNALIPVLTTAGIIFGGLLGGVVVTEAVFNWPGLGTLLLQGINARDYTVVQAVMLLVVVIFVVINLLVDILYGIIDPRIRTARSAR